MTSEEQLLQEALKRNRDLQSLIDSLQILVSNLQTEKVPYLGANNNVDLGIYQLKVLTAKLGGATDYTEFEADGTRRARGGATTWNDINVSVVPLTAGSATPATIDFLGDTGVGKLKCVGFSGTNPTPDEIPFTREILHDYEEGSDIRIHIHWYPINNTVGNVKWQMRYTWFERETVPPAPVTVSSVQATSGTAWQEQTTNFVVSGAGMKMGSRFVCNIFRNSQDVQDTYAFNAAVTDMGIHILSDTDGSRELLTK